MGTRVQIVAVLLTLGLLLGVLEMVRRRRLLERYAIVWLGSAAVLLALAAWKGLLSRVAHAVGIYYAPSALFVIAFGFVLLLLLHFSAAVSRLSEQTRVLAQRVAFLEERTRTLQGEPEESDGAYPEQPDVYGHAPAVRDREHA